MRDGWFHYALQGLPLMPPAGSAAGTNHFYNYLCRLIMLCLLIQLYRCIVVSFMWTLLCTLRCVRSRTAGGSMEAAMDTPLPPHLSQPNCWSRWGWWPLLDFFGGPFTFYSAIGHAPALTRIWAKGGGNLTMALKGKREHFSSSGIGYH